MKLSTHISSAALCLALASGGCAGDDAQPTIDAAVAFDASTLEVDAIDDGTPVCSMAAANGCAQALRCSVRWEDPLDVGTVACVSTSGEAAVGEACVIDTATGEDNCLARTLCWSDSAGLTGVCVPVCDAAGPLVPACTTECTRFAELGLTVAGTHLDEGLCVPD